MDSKPTSPSSAEEPDKPIPDDRLIQKKNPKAFIGKMGRDMVPVIAGILIALFINNWQQNYRDKKLLASTLQSLSEEFAKNTENIESYLPRQTRFLDTLRHYQSDSTQSIYDISMKTNGMGSPEIYATNWQLSVNNNSMRLLNFEAINLLSQIEAKYQELSDQDKYLYPIVYGPPIFKQGEEGTAYRRGMELWLYSYILNQQELLGLYEEFQRLVGEKRYL